MDKVKQITRTAAWTSAAFLVGLFFMLASARILIGIEWLGGWRWVAMRLMASGYFGLIGLAGVIGPMCYLMRTKPIIPPMAVPDRFWTCAKCGRRNARAGEHCGACGSTDRRSA